MKGIWAIPATRNTRTFFRLGAQTGTAWSVLLAEVPLCVLTDPKADSRLPAHLQPSSALSFRQDIRNVVSERNGKV